MYALPGARKQTNTYEQIVENFSIKTEIIKTVNIIFDKFCQNIIVQKMDNFGDTIRKLREEKELPLRTIAAFLDIDQAILSKIERAHRKPTREQVVKLAEYFKVKENDLLVAWLSDKVAYELEDEEVALKALQMAEEKVKYITKNKGKK